MIRDRVQEIYSKIIYTNHADANTQTKEERMNITKWKVAKIIANGFKKYAGNNATKSIWRGHEVVYKIDCNGRYVIITFYPKTRKKLENIR